MYAGGHYTTVSNTVKMNTIGAKPSAPKALLHLVSVIVFVFMAYGRLRIM